MAKIRKFALYITVVCSFSSVFFNRAYAQDNFYEEQKRLFYGGLLVGANFSQVDGDYFAGYHRVGINVGGIVYAQLAEHVALSMEILYSQKGSKSDIVKPVNVNGTPVFIEKYAISANYAEVPVMINYFDKRKSHFGVGLSYSQLVSSDETITTNPVMTPDFTQYPFKKYDLNALAGVQLHLVQGLFLNIRFQYSVLPIRTELPPYFARAQQYNNLWVVRVMYLFK